MTLEAKLIGVFSSSDLLFEVQKYLYEGYWVSVNELENGKWELWTK